MKYLLLSIIIAFFGCNGSKEKKVPDQKDGDSTVSDKPLVRTETCWSGMINNKIPVFVHYSFVDSILTGEIVYLNTKNKRPIKLIGKIDEDRNYRLLEFENNGNISGILSGTPSGSFFKGTWYSPASEKEWGLDLTSKDTMIDSPNQFAEPDEIFGHYHYQYSEEGYSGDFEISKLNDKVVFSILSDTGEPGHNIADVPTDTIEMTGNSFIYKFNDSDDCEFKVSFYKGFLIIQNLVGYCQSQFGHNATVEGTYLKRDKEQGTRDK